MDDEASTRSCTPSSATLLTASFRARVGSAATSYAAAWIEPQAGDRVEDLAEGLAYHYVGCAPAGGGRRDGAGSELRGAGAPLSALAGERALGLYSGQTEQTLARALELCPAGHSGRARALEYWAEALRHQGRLQEARAAP